MSLDVVYVGTKRQQLLIQTLAKFFRGALANTVSWHLAIQETSTEIGSQT